MQKRIFTTNQNSTKTDKMGRVKGFIGFANVWPGVDNEFWAKVQSSRDGELYGASQSQFKFTDLESAKAYIERTITERLNKLV